MTFARAGGSMVDVQPSDSQLGRALARGDRAGSDALLERYWPRAYGLALRLTGRPADAADAVQDAFAEVWRHRARFDAERAFRPWLFRIVSRAALSRARSEGRRRAREERSARGEAHTPDLEERLRVQERLLELEPELRAAVALKVLEGFTFRELADALEIPEGTAASRVRRGLERLRGQEERTPAALAPLLALLPGELPPLPVWRGAARAGRALVGLGLLGALSVGIVAAALAVGGAGRTGVEAGPTPAGAPRESASAAAATSASAAPAASDAARPPLAVAAAPEGAAAPRGVACGGFVLRDRVRGEPVTEREVRVHQRLRDGGVETGPARTGPRGELEVALAPDCDALAVELEGVTTPTCALPPEGTVATIDWTPPMTLTLVVVHADGRPASDAAVGLRRDLEPVRDPLSEAARLAGATASLRAGPDGRAEQVLTPGRYRIHAQAGLGYATLGPLEVAPGDPPRIVQLALRPLEGAALLRLRLRPEPGSSRVNAWSPERREERFGAVAHRGSPLELLVPAGRYTVELSGSGLRTQRWDQDLAPGEVRELERAGLPGWPLSGRVLLPRPVVGGLSQIGGEQAYAEVGQDGRFSFAWLGEEQCELRFFAAGYATRVFSVRAGEGEQTLDYGPVTTFVCRSASQTGWAVVEWAAGRVEGSFDEDGRFSVPRLPVGARARVMLGGNGPVRTAEVRVTGAGPIEVDLPPPALLGPLRLSVLDADGEPLLGGVHVVVRVARQTLRLSTDEFGRWGDVLPCGRLELAVGREDLGLEHRTLEHTPAETAVEVRLPRGPSLRGKVTGTLPAGGAYVSLAPAGWAGEALRWADVLADGSFDLGRVAPGDWAVTLIEDSGSRALEARTVTVLPEPDEHVVEFVLGG